jgi:hypothetical protein
MARDTPGKHTDGGVTIAGEADMALEREQATYEKELEKLLASAGKYVLIREDEVSGIYDTYQDALKVGYEKFGLQPFLVKQIAAVQRANRFTRDIISPCHT